MPSTLFGRFGPQVGTGSNLPIVGKPYRASFEEVHTRKSTGESLRRWGWLAQDSAGRAREDVFIPDPKEPSATRHVTTIWDPIDLKFQALDHGSGEIQKLDLAQIMQGRSADTPKLGEVAAMCALPAAPPDRLIREEIPGERLIEGVLCRGTLHRSQSSPEGIEHWFSQRLFQVVYEKTTEGDVEAVYRLFNVELEEPDASLFVLPSPGP